MKTPAREIHALPGRATWDGGALKNLTEGVRTLSDRATFWAGVVLFTTRVLKIEDLPD